MSEGCSTETGAQIYRRLLRYALPYWPVFVVSVVAMILFATTDAAFAALMRDLVDINVISKDKDQLITAPLLLILLVSVRGVTGFVTSYSLNYIGRMTIFELRKEMFNHLLLLSSSSFDRQSTGQLISKFTFNTEQISHSITYAITIVIRDSLTAIILLSYMAYLDPWLTLMFLVCGPFIVLILAVLSRRFRQISKRIQNSMGDVTSVLQESMDGQREVKIFEGQAKEKEKFFKINKTNRQQHMKYIATSVGASQIVQLLAAVTVAVIIYFLISGDDISPGKFVAYVMAMLLMLPPLKRLTTVNASIQRGIAAATGIFELLDEKAEQDRGKQTPKELSGKIVFDKVSLSYDDGASYALKEINLTIEPGQTIAIVGKSGSGKTSIMSLLPRFYEFTAGSILLDGIDIREFTLKSLRSNIALVSQNIVLFNDTIANNIAYGSLAGTSIEKIREAAIAAHADEFISEFEHGYDTMVGEDGSRLSGGQRQRIAIARALIKDSPVLLLDEATSALDTESEIAVQKGIDLLIRNRTTLVVAHRLSTIEKADVILVLEQGQIVESGSHKELLEAKGHYARYYNAQSIS